MTDSVFIHDNERWQAVVRRDTQASDRFVYAVLSTGIYCRPGCPSRLPRRENVRFFAVGDEAEAEGFRPCKRCQPRAPATQSAPLQAVSRACDMLRESGGNVTLADLARAAGLSMFHFLRLFRQVVGVTPKQYAIAQRRKLVHEQLKGAETVTDAMYAAGFTSSSRFYDGSVETLGMTPSTYRDGGRGTSIRYALTPCYLGWVLVAATDRGICTIDLGDSQDELAARLRSRFPHAQIIDGDADFASWIGQVVAFLETPSRGLALPLDVQGTAFQHRVWQQLRTVPAGTTTTYAGVAEAIGAPGAARAVAQACAHNALAVAIPCHRVLRTDGELGGYRWGLERKRKLVAREATDHVAH
jgi:AraC family transcriptional regulator of adaptative response/methylated-DNA-[protein]-cysteine methyltransferase